MVSAREIRRIILEQSKRAQVGHIACALSIADIIAALFSSVLETRAREDPRRDRLVLSKGHAALALYAGLRCAGALSREDIDTFCADGTCLGVHPDRNPPKGIDF